MTPASTFTDLVATSSDAANAAHRQPELSERAQRQAEVLARAVKWHSEYRVLMNGHKTVIFR